MFSSLNAKYELLKRDPAVRDDEIDRHELDGPCGHENDTSVHSVLLGVKLSVVASITDHVELLDALLRSNGGQKRIDLIDKS